MLIKRVADHTSVVELKLNAASPTPFLEGVRTAMALEGALKRWPRMVATPEGADVSLRTIDMMHKSLALHLRLALVELLFSMQDVTAQRIVILQMQLTSEKIAYMKKVLSLIPVPKIYSEVYNKYWGIYSTGEKLIIPLPLTNSDLFNDINKYRDEVMAWSDLTPYFSYPTAPLKLALRSLSDYLYLIANVGNTEDTAYAGPEHLQAANSGWPWYWANGKPDAKEVATARSLLREYSINIDNLESEVAVRGLNLYRGSSASFTQTKSRSYGRSKKNKGSSSQGNKAATKASEISSDNTTGIR